MNISRTRYGTLMLVALIALTLLLTMAFGAVGAPADMAQVQPDAGFVFHSAGPLADQVAVGPIMGRPTPCTCLPPVPPTT